MKNSMLELSLNQLLSLKDKPLPGVVAQNIMLPHPSRNQYTIPTKYKKAGVMILVFEQHNSWYFTLIKRASHPKDKHAGQISLPGGQMDLIDNNPTDCAIRECEEEIGARPAAIQYLHSLTPLFVPVSGFMVFPQIAIYTDYPDHFLKQENEVEEILYMPISNLLNDEIVLIKDINTHNQTLKNVPYFALNEHVIWGATAMILSEFKQCLLQSVKQ